MKFIKLGDLDAVDLKIRFLPVKYKPIFMQIKKSKTVVPPREERMEKIGEAKPPKMGRITPKTINVPPVDDLLAELDKATAPKTTPFQYQVWSFDLGTSITNDMNPSCSANCNCPPCRVGRCGSCEVEELVRQGADQETIRAAATRFRGTIYQ